MDVLEKIKTICPCQIFFFSLVAIQTALFLLIKEMNLHLKALEISDVCFLGMKM